MLPSVTSTHSFGVDGVVETGELGETVETVGFVGGFVVVGGTVTDAHSGVDFTVEVTVPVAPLHCFTMHSSSGSSHVSPGCNKDFEDYKKSLSQRPRFYLF